MFPWPLSGDVDVSFAHTLAPACSHACLVLYAMFMALAGSLDARTQSFGPALSKNW